MDGDDILDNTSPTKKTKEKKLEKEKEGGKGKSIWNFFTKSKTKDKKDSRKKKSNKDVEKGDGLGSGTGIKEGKDKEGKDNEKAKSNFPCCFYIPIDIAMQGFALIDIVYYSIFALLWAIFLALEPFAGKDEKLALENLNNSTNPNTYLHVNKERLLGLGEAALEELLHESRGKSRSAFDEDEELDFDSFRESTTIFTTIHDSIDKQNEARVYSRIARRFQLYGQEVDDGCGRNYYADYLYSHQLEITRNLFEEVAKKIIAASMMYAVIGCVLLTTICCFRGYIASKVLIIFLWYLQLVPNYLILRTAVMSQSQRFCIYQYGVHRTFRGQRFLSWTLLIPLMTYKLYESFIWANYIRRYFKNKEGKLTDESYFSTAKLDERTHRQLQKNPFLAKNDFQHHRRPIGKAQLFRHTHAHHVDQDSALKETHKGNGRASKRSSSSD